MSRPTLRATALAAASTLLVLAACARAGMPAPSAAQAPAPTPRRVVLRFVQSPHADFLFYLLYRNHDEFPALDSVVDLTGIPRASSLVSLPEAAASTRVEQYAELYPLLEPYRTPAGRIVTAPHPRILAYGNTVPPYDSLRAIVAAGEAHFPRFLAFWNAHIAPVERANIEAWRVQQAACAPLDTLERLAGFPLRADTLDVASIALHLAGSANYTPAGVYTTTFRRPNLPWVIGHEATHLLVSPYLGRDWRAHPEAAEAIRRVEAAGGRDEDIEEALSLHMQVALSQRCGLTDPSRRLSTEFERDTPRRRILAAMEAGWPDYRRARPGESLIDFMLRSTRAAFPTP